MYPHNLSSGNTSTKKYQIQTRASMKASSACTNLKKLSQEQKTKAEDYKKLTSWSPQNGEKQKQVKSNYAYKLRLELPKRDLKLKKKSSKASSISRKKIKLAAKLSGILSMGKKKSNRPVGRHRKNTGNQIKKSIVESNAESKNSGKSQTSLKVKKTAIKQQQSPNISRIEKYIKPDLKLVDCFQKPKRTYRKKPVLPAHVIEHRKLTKYALKSAKARIKTLKTSNKFEGFIAKLKESKVLDSPARCDKYKNNSSLEIENRENKVLNYFVNKYLVKRGMLKEDKQAEVEAPSVSPSEQDYLKTSKPKSVKLRSPVTEKSKLYSRAMAKALTQHPEGLSTSQLYNWISINYPDFQKDRRDWKGIIRYNLRVRDYFKPTGRIREGNAYNWVLDRSCFNLGDDLFLPALPIDPQLVEKPLFSLPPIQCSNIENDDAVSFQPIANSFNWDAIEQEFSGQDSFGDFGFQEYTDEDESGIIYTLTNNQLVKKTAQFPSEMFVETWKTYEVLQNCQKSSQDAFMEGFSTWRKFEYPEPKADIGCIAEINEENEMTAVDFEQSNAFWQNQIIKQ